jgi:hypothetical protein
MWYTVRQYDLRGGYDEFTKSGKESARFIGKSTEERE